MIKLALLLLFGCSAVAGRSIQSDPQPEYDDEFARRKLFPIAAAAYSDHPEHCLSNTFQNASLVGTVFARCEPDSAHLCVGYIGLLHSERAISLAFRGTNGFLQLVVEVNHVVLKNKHRAPIGGLVGTYFYNGFEALYNAGIKDLFAAVHKKYPDYKVWLAGHSLGGALASIAASQMKHEFALPDDQILLTTFGQPRTGDNDYASVYPQHVPQTFRVTHNRDMVVHVPPENFESYLHHTSEVWYANKMDNVSSPDYVVCREGESKQCSDKYWFAYSISDHTHYFGEYVSTFGVKGCHWAH